MKRYDVFSNTHAAADKRIEVQSSLENDDFRCVALNNPSSEVLFYWLTVQLYVAKLRDKNQLVHTTVSQR